MQSNEMNVSPGGFFRIKSLDMHHYARPIILKFATC